MSGTKFQVAPKSVSSSHVAASEPSKVNFSEGDGDSQAAAADSEPSSEDVEPESEPSAPNVARSESKLTTRTVSVSAPGSVQSEHSILVEEDRKPLFKLPLLVERHHGAGCAMEISVLEKHDNTCVYKKEGADGRSIDDRVGSYECIGRMVFRTCNANELESDSSGSQGIKPGRGPPPHHTVEKKPSLPKPVPPTAIASQPASRQPSVTSAHPKKQPSTMSSPSVYGSAKYHESSHTSFKSQAIEEEPAVKENQEPVESYRSRHNRNDHQHQIMMASTHANPQAVDFGRQHKAHYYGDDCKLHGPKAPVLLPKNPLLLPSSQFDKIYASKKVFPKVSDESNQTDTHVAEDKTNKSKLSLETISSLTDLSKRATKRKSTFLGSWFRKGSIRSPTLPEVKKFKK